MVNYQYKVSVIVPCYNTKPWLDECLQSLVDQTLQEIEIICVNDGSTDGTGVKLKEWQAKYPNKIKVIYQQNGGSSNARNAGMAIAQGECIGFVDSDDFINICMYEELYKILTDYTADVVKCDLLTFIDKASSNSSKKKISINSEIFNLSVVAVDAIYKKNFLQREKIKFVDHIHFAEDHAFTYELLMYSPHVCISTQKLYFYRQQRKEQKTSYNGKNIYDILKVFEYLQDRFSNSRLNNLTLIHSLILRKQISLFALSVCNIQYRYKKDFLFKASNLIFNNNKALTIYKTMLFAKYRNIFSYFIAPIAVILFHSCYLWQKLSFKNIKNYFINKFN